MADKERELRRQRILKNSQNRLDMLLGVKKSLEVDLISSNSSVNEQIKPTQMLETATLEEEEEKGEKKKELKAAACFVDENRVIYTNISSRIEKKIVEADLIETGEENNKLKLLNNNNNNNKNVLDSELQYELKFKKGKTLTTSNGNGTIKSDDTLSNQEVKCKFNGYSNTEITVFFLIAFVSTLLIYSKYSVYTFQNVMFPFFTFELAHLIVHYKYIPSTSSQFQMFSTLLQLCGISHKSLKNLMMLFNFLFILIDNFILYIFSFVCINIILFSLLNCLI